MKFKKIQGEKFKKFTHRECEYFPCHQVNNSDNFNCLFCYCPLYALGDQCGGDFSYVYDVKDCSTCIIPHSENGHSYITKKFHEISELANKNRNQQKPESTSAVKRASIKIL
jgi:Zn-finger protein